MSNYSLEQFKQELEYHDWYFARSDDHSVYAKGRDACDRLTRIAQHNGWQDVYDEVRKRKMS